MIPQEISKNTTASLTEMYHGTTMLLIVHIMVLLWYFGHIKCGTYILVLWYVSKVHCTTTVLLCKGYIHLQNSIIMIFGHGPW